LNSAQRPVQLSLQSAIVCESETSPPTPLKNTQSPLMTTSDEISPILPDSSGRTYFSFRQGKPTTWHHPRKPQPKGGLERLKLYFRLLFERRNMVKMPSIATGSFSLFFQSLLACVLYVTSGKLQITYRA
jgi:hypothetical protein